MNAYLTRTTAYFTKTSNYITHCAKLPQTKIIVLKLTPYFTLSQNQDLPYELHDQSLNASTCRQKKKITIIITNSAAN